MFDNLFFDFWRRGDPFSARDAAIKAAETSSLIFFDLLNLVINRGRYIVPDGVDPRFLELSFLTDNAALIAKTHHGIMSLRAVQSGGLDKYGYPTSVLGVDYTGRSYGRFIPDTPGNAEDADAVAMFGGLYRLPAIYKIAWYTDRLSRLQDSMNAAVANLMGTTIILAERGQERAIRRAYRDAGNGLPIIIYYGGKDSGFSSEPKVISTSENGDIVKTLTETIDKVKSDFLLDFGVDASGVINKMSGVSDEELDKTRGQTSITWSEDVRIRKDAMKRASEKFGGEWDYIPNITPVKPSKKETEEGRKVDDSVL